MRQACMAVLLTLCIQLAFADPNSDLATACKQGNIDGVKKALEAGADVNKPDENGNTPLTGAFFWPEIVQLLLDKGADPNGGNYPALVSACNNYSVEVIDKLLQKGADPNKPGKADPSVVFRKLIADEKAKGESANEAAIKAWEGALANVKPTEVLPIQIVVQQTNCVPCLQKLIDKGAKTALNLSDNSNLMHTLAAFGMKPEERRSQFKNGKAAVESFGLKTPEWYVNLPEAVNGTSAQMLDLLKKAGVDINQKNSNGYTPLLTALIAGKIDAAKALVKAGAEVNHQTPDKQDALSFAAKFGDVELLKLLVEKGADVNFETWGIDKTTGEIAKGFTALSIAVINNHVGAATYLLGAGCKPTDGISGFYRAENGCAYHLSKKSSIFFAIDNNNMEMVKLLADASDFWMNNLMEIEAQTGNLPKGSAEKGACIMASGKFSPSSYADELGFEEIQEYLESKGK